MAAGDSEVTISNQALGIIGSDPIVSLNDNNKRAIQCKTFYDQKRREVLEAFPWRCARRVATLAASSVTPPIANWLTMYPLPVDCLAVRELPQNKGIDWEIMNPLGTGPMLMANASGSLPIAYTMDLVDPSQFAPLLCRWIAAELATQIAIPLTASNAKLQLANAAVLRVQSDARLSQSVQANPKEWDEDIWLRSRGDWGAWPGWGPVA